MRKESPNKGIHTEPHNVPEVIMSVTMLATKYLVFPKRKQISYFIFNYIVED